MRMEKFYLESNQRAQIYMSKEEQENQKVMKKMNQLKKQYPNICIFISGKKDTIKTIQEMLNYEKTKKTRL
ncbi:MAG: hypothetical protein HFJ34_05935 [Clostridia bacterium]|nr:hypothetical protein [Clostridia bacterium]